MQTYKYLILGGGMVAGHAAQELVQRGLRPGELAIVSADTVPPYERPPLSKGFLAGREAESSIFINDETFYREHGIDVRLRTIVERVEPAQGRLRTRDGEELGYEKLLIATGARVRTLDVPGGDLAGVLYLRSLDDAKRIRARMEGARRAVVIGSGFIGMETAAVLAQKGIATTMVFPEERVWQRFFTPEMSAFFQRYYETRGVSLMSGTSATAFQGDGRLTGVVTNRDGILPADIAIAGVGVVPAAEALADAGLRLDNGVVVNEYLETGVPGVYAAGDAANYYDVLFAKQRRVEHWDNAVEQGKHAARVMMGERIPFVHVPYFFSDVFDLSYEYWGDTAGADAVTYRGDLDSSSFSVWWTKAGRLVAAFVLNRPGEERELALQWVREGRSVAALPV
jgi:NADPH-dependent 2,4-dienoyl-CoA reductase/sulfur reductase-like enzyme